MKYVLVDRSNEVVSTVDLASEVGLSGAKTYFRGIKRLEEKEFEKLWNVMTKKEHRRIKANIEFILPYAPDYIIKDQELVNLFTQDISFFGGKLPQYQGNTPYDSSIIFIDAVTPK